MKKGFTLLEMIFVIGIMVLILSIAIGYYKDFLNFKQLEVESTKLANTIEEARKRANAGDTSTTCSGDFLGYRIALTSTDYKLQAHCSISDSTVNTTAFSSSVQANAAATIDFAPVNPAVTAACIILSKPSYSVCRCIQVAGSGNINEAVCSSCSICP